MTGAPPAVPRGHPLLGHASALQSDPLAFLTRCALTGADVVPLRLPFLRAFLLLNPADIERVLVTDHRQFVKPLWLRTPAVRRLLGDGLVTSDGAPWRAQRRACQPAFHPALLPDYGRTVAALAERMLDDWSPGQTRDLTRDMTRLTLNIIGQTLLGTDLGPQAAEIGTVMDTLMACFSADRS
nr:cytochrome P450 [Armatimonadota bacterium]